MLGLVQKPSRRLATAAPVVGELRVFGVQGWLAWFATLCALHALCYLYVVRSGSAFTKKHFRPKPHLAAHVLPQLLGFVVLAYHGCVFWFAHQLADTEPLGDFFSHGEVMGTFMTGFQLYEAVACIPPSAERLRGNAYEMLGHHVTTFYMGLLSYYYRSFHYYCPFFMGISELSSLPLAGVDFFKYFPAIRKSFPNANEACRVAFAVSFLTIRGVWWPYISLDFWRRAVPVMRGAATTEAPGFVLATFMFLNVAMTLLQFYWASIILTAIVQKARGDARHKEA